MQVWFYLGPFHVLSGPSGVIGKCPGKKVSCSDAAAQRDALFDQADLRSTGPIAGLGNLDANCKPMFDPSAFQLINQIVDHFLLIQFQIGSNDRALRWSELLCPP